ncbi:CYTH-like domain-containing protein [Mycotypha africana]|uniref:CYTH-like domain-containing protein n=1 Tax=Mycotypha africana TaxID=64632 RepID=UPI0023003998|nr:CYTH-like domain-containing protein [Mycotypha africana]KAI8988469.1 CYTH-like domain-containing protein [Mycotypha africana]
METKKRSADKVDLASSNGRIAEEPPAKKAHHSSSAYGSNHYREPSIFGIKPVDDMTKYVAEFIGKYCHLENVEIEAKLGIFVDKQTGQRIDMDAYTETVIPSGHMRQYRFESNMPLEQHRHYNKILNDMVNKTQARDYRGERIKYKHTMETDRFYIIPNSKSKIRVSTEQSTNQIVPNGIVEKERVADLNIHAPNQPLDYRISINIEHPRTKPESPPVFERNKDRISYQHGGIHFDLTQVKGANVDQDPTDLRHELELEFADATLLQQEKSKYDRKESSQYTPMIEVFMNNIRILSRSALKTIHPK